MRNKIICFIIGNLFLLSGQIAAQDQKVRTLKFDLKQAVDYALENNQEMINADIDIAIAKAKKNETRAIGLPQVNGKISYSNFLDIAKTLLPDFVKYSVVKTNMDIFGLIPQGSFDGNAPMEYIEVQFGQKHNAEFGVTVNQLLFNSSYIIGLQAAKAYVNQAFLQRVKTKVELIETIKKSYYTSLVTQKNIEVLERLIVNLKDTKKQSKALASEGFIEEISIRQLDLIESELETTLINAQKMSQVSMYYLKFALGLNLNDHLELTEDLDNLIANAENEQLLKKSLNTYKNINIKVIDNQIRLAILDLRNKKAENLPSLSTFFSTNRKAMNNDFKLLSADQKWFPSTVWGVQMDIPIFSGLSRANQIKQKKLALKKAELAKESIEKNINIEYKNALASYDNAYRIYKNKIKNREITQDIFTKTEIKFKEGMAGRTDLNQAHDQLLQAETSLLNSILELLNAKATLERITTES